MDCDQRDREHQGYGQGEEKGYSHGEPPKNREQGTGNRDQQEKQRGNPAGMSISANFEQ
jgi:hypothetical protein